MLSVFICEDNQEQRENVEKYIRNFIMIEDVDMELALSSADPLQILNYLESHPGTQGLYFLDVDLNNEISGIELASQIRELDDIGKIVFVTTHGELSYLTFLYKVEAMDYIIKDKLGEMERRVRECMEVALKRYLNDSNPAKKVFKVKVGDKVRVIPYDSIMFFESSLTPHKVILHLENAQLEFYGSIKELEEIDKCFFRCHKSYVINKNNIKYIDTVKREVEMINDEICLVSVRKIKGLS